MMSSRASREGRSTTICLSKRPGRTRAASRMSGELVAAGRGGETGERRQGQARPRGPPAAAQLPGAPMTMTPLFCSKPSMRVSSWLMVWRTETESWLPRRPPTASISSMKMIHGAWVPPGVSSCAAAALPAPRSPLPGGARASHVLLGCLEEVAHSPRTHAHEHLLELRARGKVEGDVGLAGHGATEQGLPRARGADHQHAFGQLGAHGRELGRVLQRGGARAVILGPRTPPRHGPALTHLEVLHDLLQLLDFALHPANVRESGVGLRHLVDHVLGHDVAQPAGSAPRGEPLLVQRPEKEHQCCPSKAETEGVKERLLPARGRRCVWDGGDARGAGRGAQPGYRVQRWQRPWPGPRGRRASSPCATRRCLQCAP